MRCLNCKNETKNSRNKYCNNKCQKDYEYKIWIEEWLKGKKNGMKGHLSISNHIRRYLIETRGNRCEKCGWSKINPATNKVPIEIHHLDGDALNNEPSNLQLLCPNCHSLTPTYKASNMGCGRKMRVS